MIDVKEKGEDVFEVTVSEDASSTTHTVTLSDEYHRRLTGGEGSKTDLVRRSFEFLLQREGKESILRRFDLPVISRYFPEYERIIGSAG